MPFTPVRPEMDSAVRNASRYRNMAVRTLLVVLGCAMLAGCGGLSSGPSRGGPIVVEVAPTAFTLGVGSNYQFSATVTGSSNTGVNWQVNGVAGGNATVGTIDSAGLYIAPGSIPNQTILISAVAQADSASNGTAAITLALTDPLGTATGQTIPCPIVAGPSPGTCYSVALTCPGIADLNGYLWVNLPSGTPKGTVMMTAGANSEDLYAAPTAFVYGVDVVNGLLAADYITVQTSFGGVFTTSQPFGWQTGPGGVRRVACRYATLAQWVKDNINSPAGAPLCATGNSAGGALIGYALAHYGETSIFTMVEPTSGPPFSRLDYSCECNQPRLPDPCVPGTELSQCVDLDNAEKYIDPAYSAPICSQAVQTQSTANGAQFLSDSILSPEATLTYPSTYVHFAWGGEDGSSAPVMGQEWEEVITPTSGRAFACVADAPHGLADVLDGAEQIVNDIVSYCQ
jgi:hypothetical protein